MRMHVYVHFECEQCLPLHNEFDQFLVTFMKIECHLTIKLQK